MHSKITISIYELISNTVAPITAGVFGLFGGKFAIALLFAILTKIIIYLFEKEIKTLAIYIRKCLVSLNAFLKSLRK